MQKIIGTGNVPLILKKDEFLASNCIAKYHRSSFNTLRIPKGTKEATILKMGSYSSIVMYQYWDNRIIYWEYTGYFTDMSQ